MAILTQLPFIYYGLGSHLQGIVVPDSQLRGSATRPLKVLAEKTSDSWMELFELGMLSRPKGKGGFGVNTVRGDDGQSIEITEAHPHRGMGLCSRERGVAVGKILQDRMLGEVGGQIVN